MEGGKANVVATMGLGPAPDHEIRARGEKAALFLFLVCPQAPEPTYISDFSRLVDFLDFDEAARACRRHYGFALTREQFEAPLWRLLDGIEGAGP